AGPAAGRAGGVGGIARGALSAVTPGFTADNRERLFALRIGLRQHLGREPACLARANDAGHPCLAVSRRIHLWF
ncbi:hypothetical protein, partial [Klebsiella pneumoniae]|uniref:hypothetical protein n=1 Tax=Klebsiella pneumoniae TaxID=573 RepID=UPI0039695920